MKKIKEYSGEFAKRYTQHKAKTIILNPALDRVIPKAKSGDYLLDAGCGHGTYSELALEKGYSYKGFDASNDMLHEAKLRYPQLEFKQGDVKNFSRLYSEKFSIVLLNMVLPVMKSQEELSSVIRECASVLAEKGKLIISTSHPAGDPYMQTFFFQRGDVVTDFKGYFASGVPFTVKKQFDTGKYEFNDVHFPIADYISAINSAGLFVSRLDECEPSKNHRDLGPDYYDEKINYPTFIIFVCQNR